MGNRHLYHVMTKNTGSWKRQGKKQKNGDFSRFRTNFVHQNTLHDHGMNSRKRCPRYKHQHLEQAGMWYYEWLDRNITDCWSFAVLTEIVIDDSLGSGHFLFSEQTEQFIVKFDGCETSPPNDWLAGNTIGIGAHAHGSWVVVVIDVPLGYKTVCELFCLETHAVL